MIVDDLARRVMGLYIENQGERPDGARLVELVRTHGDKLDELIELCDEIDAMKAEGLLFKPAREVTLKQLYPTAPRIKSMCLDVCHDCNLRCKYCFAGTGDFGTGQRKMMSVETGKRAVDFLIEASGPRVNLDIDFFGGEPLLNWKLVKELTKYCEEEGPKHGKKIRLTLTTNAVLLDDEKIKFINEHMKNVVLSIDGRPEVQDDMRPCASGKGSYDLVTKRIGRFVKARGDKEYYVRGTYTSANLDFSKDVQHLAELGYDQISMEPVVGDESNAYCIRDEDLPVVFEEYERLAEDYLKAREEGRPYHFFHFNVDVEGGPCLFKKMKGCGVGSEYCAVTPDGDIYPCHQFVGEEQFIMGNVFNDPPLNRPVELEEALNELILPNKQECKACWAQYFCSGGCPANAFHASGELDGLYEKGCQLQKKRLEAALWIQAKLREKREEEEEEQERLEA